MGKVPGIMRKTQALQAKSMLDFLSVLTWRAQCVTNSEQKT